MPGAKPLNCIRTRSGYSAVCKRSDRAPATTQNRPEASASGRFLYLHQVRSSGRATDPTENQASNLRGDRKRLASDEWERSDQGGSNPSRHASGSRRCAFTRLRIRHGFAARSRRRPSSSLEPEFTPESREIEARPLPCALLEVLHSFQQNVDNAAASHGLDRFPGSLAI